MFSSIDLMNIERKYGANNYESVEVVLAKGKGVWVWDVEDHKYMDCLSAYSAVNHGHLHPKIIGAVKDQLERITLTSRAFFNDKLPLFVEKVCQFTGKDMFLPMNSGAEGVETAIKTMRKWGYEVKGIPAETGEIIVMADNFHGRTTTIVSFSTDPGSHNHFGPFTPGFKIVPYNDVKAIENAISKNTIGVMLEPIQGEAGVVVPDEGFLTAVSKLCKQAGILFCSDEIQTGFGRTGKNFCCDHENVVPDIYILGKALGGGIMPVSGIAANKEILDVIKAGQHGSTFGGNPLASVVAMAAIDVLVEERLVENSANMGNYFMGELRKLAGDKIDLVRGKGLLVGIRIAEKYGKAKPFIKALKTEGILAKDTHEKIIRFAPPLIITKDEIDWAMERIRKVFA